MPKRPRDPNQLAKAIVDIATGEAEDPVIEKQRERNPRGYAGGVSGGAARAASLSGARKVEIAKRGAAARWKADQYGSAKR